MTNPGWFSVFDWLVQNSALYLYKDGQRMNKYQILILFGIVGVLWLITFILQGIALYKMAKKENSKRAYLAFVPFAYTLLVEELAGEVSFFGHKVKHLGLWAMILELISVAYHAFVVWAMAVLYVKNGALLEYTAFGGIVYPGWPQLSGTALYWLEFYQLGVESLIVLVESIIFLILYMGLYKRYAYSNAKILSVAGLFVPFFKPITVFCLRNREPFDYEAAIRAKREAFRRQQQQWGNPYGSPYGNPYGNSTPNQPSQEEKPKDPFEEFSEENKGNSSGGQGDNDFFG